MVDLHVIILFLLVNDCILMYLETMIFSIYNFLRLYISLLWGPTNRGPGPFALRESEGPIREELWPKLYNTARNNFWGAAEDSLVLGRSTIPPG